MSNIKIFKLNEVDLDNIVYGDVITHNNLSTININYLHENKYVPLLIKTEYFYSFDTIKEIDMKHFTHEIVLLLQCKTEDKTKQTVDFFNALDKKIIQDGINEKYDWNTYEELTYKVLVRKVENKDDIYNNGVLKVKLYKNGRFNTIMYNKNKQQLDPIDYNKYFDKYCYVKLLIELVSLKKNDKGVFEIFVRPHQVLVDNSSPPINLVEDFKLENSYSSSVASNHEENIVTPYNSLSSPLQKNEPYDYGEEVIQLNTTSSEDDSISPLDSLSDSALDNSDTDKNKEIISIQL